MSVPAVKSIANSPLFLSPPPGNKKAFLRDIPDVVHYPRTSKYHEMWDIMNQEIELCSMGERDVPGTCKVIVERVNVLLEER